MKLPVLIKNIACFLLCFPGVYAGAQESGVASLAKKAVQSLENFQEKYPQEKVFLQTDRSYYAAGETIWMKAWLTQDGKPGFLSKILYVDIVNDEGKVVDKKMLQVDSLSSVALDFLLSNALPTGTYQVRAYTLWMLNFKDFLFTTQLYITGTGKSPGAAVKPVAGAHFFPEGGDLVNGLESVVGFKVVDQYGTGLNAKGSVEDASGKTVASLQTDHDGMGSFVLTPQKGVRYTARFDTEYGVSKISLPLPKEEGIVLKITNTSPNRLFVLVARNTATPERYNNLLIIAQMHHAIVFQGEVNFKEGATGAAIQKKNLPPGIMQVTVFDSAGNPLAERLAFINNIIQVAPGLISTTRLSPKTKNSVDLTLTGVRKPNASILITDAAGDKPAGETLLSSLLLSSDLRGIIHQPAYYFRNNDSITNKHLDLLLMTQGWRRFAWKDMMANNFPALHYPVESSLVVRGRVTKPGTASPVTEGKVDLIIKTDDSTSLLSVASVTDKGEFGVDNLHFKKAASVAYQGTNSKKEKLVVDVNLYPQYIDTLQKIDGHKNGTIYTLPPAGSYAEGYLARKVKYSDSLDRQDYLSNVTVKAKKLSPLDSLGKVYTSGLFQFGGRKLASNNAAYFSIWQLIRTIPGFVIEGDMTNPSVTLSRTAGLNVFSDNSSSASTFSDGEGNAPSGVSFNYVENGIAFFLNEIPVSRDVLDQLSMTDVAFVKTYVGAESSAIGPYNGVVAVYTTKGAGVGSSILNKNFAKGKLTGYSVTRQFYAPDYEINPAQNSAPDDRITLMWKPVIHFDAAGKASIPFFTNDTSKKIRILIQGLDADGRFIFKEQVVE